MSASNAAFAKFDEWRRSNAVLRLTMLTDVEKPEVLFIRITAIDEEALLVAFVKHGQERDLQPRLDLSSASFTVGGRVLEVKRSENDVLMFEESPL